MAACITCGFDAGNYDQHYECVQALNTGKTAEQIREEALAKRAAAGHTEADELVEKLTPVLMGAAKRAGLIGAFTLVGVALALAILFAILRMLISS